MNPESCIYITGHTGMVGTALTRTLRARGFSRLVTATHAELDLRNQHAVQDFFAQMKVEYVFAIAAHVGGIQANSRSPVDFLYDNAMISMNVLHAAANSNVKKLVYLGSSCIYPREAPQPLGEDALLTGPPEPTNEGYALAKILGVKLCEYYYRQYGKCFISAIPSNLFGEGDRFNPQDSHVVPGLLRRFHEAKVNQESSVVVWGSGKPRREFLYSEDLVSALLLVMEKYESPSPINIGSGFEITIAELAQAVKRVTGFPGEIVLDRTKPDGMPRKLLSSHKIRALGWRPQAEFEEALRNTYAWAVREKVFDQK